MVNLVQRMYKDEPNNTGSKIVASLVVIIAVALLAMGAKTYGTGKRSPVIAVSSPAASGSVAVPVQAQNSPPSSSSSSSYKDGTYSAVASYFVPPGQESISVTLTVANGIVTNSSVQNSENNPESAAFQQDFSSQYKNYVVGKSLKSLQLSYVAGASDTTQAFDAAVARIQNQAQA